MVAEDWAFHPADINMDSVVDCADLAYFSSDPYDWNLNGELTDGDRLDLAAVVGASLADLDGDGMVNNTDSMELLARWGSCPPTGECVGDLDCDEVIGIEDSLILLSVLGS